MVQISTVVATVCDKYLPCCCISEACLSVPDVDIRCLCVWGQCSPVVVSLNLLGSPSYIYGQVSLAKTSPLWYCCVGMFEPSFLEEEVKSGESVVVNQPC